MIDFEKILKLKDVKKSDLARFLEIGPQNVDRTIKNERIPFSLIEKICSFLSISVIDALRLSGYDDTPNSKLSVGDYAKLATTLAEPFSAKLVEMFSKGEIFPASVVEAKDKEIQRLNREIGRLTGGSEE